jgi:hypothetical protein
VKDTVDIQSPLWLRIFSARERWFHKHRACVVTRTALRGWDGSHFDRWTCEEWRKGFNHVRKSWYDTYSF